MQHCGAPQAIAGAQGRHMIQEDVPELEESAIQITTSDTSHPIDLIICMGAMQQQWTESTARLR